WFQCAAVWHMFSTWRAEKPGNFRRWLVLAVLACMIVMSVRAVASNVWDFFFVAPMFWMLLGLACSSLEAKPAAKSGAGPIALLRLLLRPKRFALLIVVCVLPSAIASALLSPWMVSRYEKNPYRYASVVPVLIESGRTNDALEVLEAVHRMQPTERGASYYKAKVLLLENRPSEALDEVMKMGLSIPISSLFERRISSPPSDEVLHELVRVLADRLAEEGKLISATVTKLGVAYARTGAYDTALHHFKRVVEELESTETVSSETGSVAEALRSAFFVRMAEMPESELNRVPGCSAGTLARMLVVAGGKRIRENDFVGSGSSFPLPFLVYTDIHRQQPGVIVNGEKVLTGGLYGYNVVIFDLAGGVLKAATTNTSSLGILELVEEAPDGVFVLVISSACGWQSQLFSGSGRKALALIGGDPETKRPKGAAWAVLGRKGMKPGEAAEVVWPLGNGPLIVFSASNTKEKKRTTLKRTEEEPA
ncbi:hypothetical protein ACFL1X_14375, partial [Candidatus Hydrogenedentota bacterium]